MLIRISLPGLVVTEEDKVRMQVKEIKEGMDMISQ